MPQAPSDPRPLTRLPGRSLARPLPPALPLVAAVLLYFFAQSLLRSSGVAWGVEKDEAEQLLWSQHWALGYGTQPPLYTWLQAAVFVLTGPGVAGLALLKNTLLAGTVLLWADAARRLLPPRTAVAATASLALLPPLAWEAQRDLSHSVLLVFAAALTLWAIVRLLQARRGVDYLVLGLAAAVGLLAKYSYLMLAGVWLVALAAVPEGRALLRDRRFLFATLLPAALLVLPHALWLLDHWAAASAGTLDKLDGADTAGAFAQRAAGLRGLLRALLGFAGLWVLVAALLFVRRRRGVAPPAVPGPWPRLVRAYGLVTLLLLLGLVAAGAGVVKARWLLPLLLPLPLFVFVACPRWSARPRALAALTGAGVAMAVLIGAALAWRPAWEAARGRVNDVHLPVPALAAAIGPLPPGTPLVAAPSHLAGSLRLAYPRHPVAVLGGVAPPGAVVVVDAAQAGLAPERAALAARRGPPQRLVLAPRGGEERPARLQYLLWRPR